MRGLRRWIARYNQPCRSCRGRCCQGASSEYFGGLDHWAARCAGRTVGTPTAPHAGCGHLGPNGCTLDDRDRPARCVAYVCPELIQAMPAWARLAVLVEELRLYSVCARMLAVLERER